jgi:hypothetical protein
MKSLPNEPDDPKPCKRMTDPNLEFEPRARSEIQRLEYDEQLLRDIGEPAAADKILVMRRAIAAAWKAHAEAESARQLARKPEQTHLQPATPRGASTPEDETRALAPAYDYIRALVAKWAAERD